MGVDGNERLSWRKKTDIGKRGTDREKERKGSRICSVRTENTNDYRNEIDGRTGEGIKGCGTG